MPNRDLPDAFPEDIVASKKRLRTQGRAIRAALSERERASASAAICDRLKSLFADFDETIAVYLATPDEANIDDFIAWLLARGVPVFAPQGDVFARLESLRSVTIGRFGVREPVSGLQSSSPRIILVPGLLFDAHGGRLGFGVGWYDRALARFPQALKIGVAFDEQMVDKVPCEAHDVKINAVITPNAEVKI